MTTITAKGEISRDGTLEIRVPTSLPEGPVEAVVVLQPVAPAGLEPHRSARSGLFEGLGYDLDLDAALREIRGQWERDQ